MTFHISKFKVTLGAHLHSFTGDSLKNYESGKIQKFEALICLFNQANSGKMQGRHLCFHFCVFLDLASLHLQSPRAPHCRRNLLPLPRPARTCIPHKHLNADAACSPFPDQLAPTFLANAPLQMQLVPLTLASLLLHLSVTPQFRRNLLPWPPPVCSCIPHKRLNADATCFHGPRQLAPTSASNSSIQAQLASIT